MADPDIVELEVWDHQKGSATFGLHCSYLTDETTRLSDRANEAFEWAVENRSGPIEFGGVNAAGFVYLVFRNEKDAVLFKTFWL